MTETLGTPAAAPGLSLIDGAALLLVVGFAVAGAFKGAIRLIVGVVALVAGTALAGQYAGAVGADTWPGVTSLENPQRAGVLVGGLVILVGTLVVGALVARLLRKAAEESELGGVDRLVGFMLGGLKGAVIAALLTLGLMFVAPVDQSGSLKQQAEASHALAGTRSLVDVCKPWLPVQTVMALEGVLHEPPQQP